MITLSCLCTIKLKIGLIQYYFVAIYRPHSGNVSEFCNALSNIFTRIPNLRNNKVILVGDFNVNLLRENDNSVRVLCDYLRSYFFVPYINNVTRYSKLENVEPSLLDHIWLNFLEVNIQTGIIMSDLTDHCPVFMGIPVRSASVTQSKLIHFRDHSDECITKLRSEITQTLDLSSCTEIDEKIDLFNDRINEAYNKCCPIRSKTITNKYNKSPWITPAKKTFYGISSIPTRIFKHISVHEDESKV